MRHKGTPQRQMSSRMRSLLKRKHFVLNAWLREARLKKFTGAIITQSFEMYFRDGLLHRPMELGPALVCVTGTKRRLYFECGVQIDPSPFIVSDIAPEDCVSVAMASVFV